MNAPNRRGREAGGQSCRVEGPEEPRGVEQRKAVHVGQPSLHIGICSPGLAGRQQLCREGPGLPVNNKCEFVVHLHGDEGKPGCISKLQSSC